MDNTVISLVNKIIIMVMKYTAVASIMLIIIYRNDYSFALGLIFGNIISLINFYIMANCINNMFDGKVRSKYYHIMFYIIRILCSCTAILYAMKFNSLNLITTVIGLLSLKIFLTLQIIFKKEIYL